MLLLLEGSNGAGKSTLALKLAEKLSWYLFKGAQGFTGLLQPAGGIGPERSGPWLIGEMYAVAELSTQMNIIVDRFHLSQHVWHPEEMTYADFHNFDLDLFHRTHSLLVLVKNPLKQKQEFPDEETKMKSLFKLSALPKIHVDRSHSLARVLAKIANVGD